MTGGRMCAITKDYHFSASHRLTQLPPDHPCHRLHGHNYVVRVELVGPVGADGMVLDYGDLGPLWEYIDTTLDHRHLNDVLEAVPTTAEALAWHLDQVVRALVPGIVERGLAVRVGVSETPRTWARTAW